MEGKKTKTGNGTKQTYRFDKRVYNVSVSTTGTTQNDVTITTITYPCVIMGIIITGGSLVQPAETVGGNIQWVFILVEDGDPNNTIGFNGQTYNPEQSTMCFGCGFATTTTPYQCYHKTKTGRKLRQGDEIHFIVRNNSIADVDHTYTIQFFLKI